MKTDAVTMNFRIPRAIFNRLELMAQAQNRSRNFVIIELLGRVLDDTEAKLSVGREYTPPKIETTTDEKAEKLKPLLALWQKDHLTRVPSSV
jgi:hypothetical protein